MRIIVTKVYQFAELDAAAKEKARNWYRQYVFSDSCDWDYIYDDAAECAHILGIDIARRRGTNEPCIYFSGFSSQGDGACFEGSYAYKKGAAKAIRQYAPEDCELHRIADELQAVQKRNFWRLQASMTHRGHYSHSGCMDVDVEDSTERYRDLGDAEEEVRDLMRAFANWIYSQLRAEYEYQSSDEAVEEAITANEYEFTEDGERA